MAIRLDPLSIPRRVGAPLDFIQPQSEFVRFDGAVHWPLDLRGSGISRGQVQNRQTSSPYPGVSEVHGCNKP